ncbi:MAG: phosphonate ABC transporter, permease protein PhnE [Desulfovibrionales bacterium]|nr:MAG: phosphonate ABC transporter, permease protein PhnE [Desulfovibrionales bacterium]
MSNHLRAFAKKVLLPVFCLATLIYAFNVSAFSFGALSKGLPMMGDMLLEMTPPNFTFWRRYLSLMWETIVIGVWGTFLGTLISLPIGFLAATNTSPSKWIYAFFKSLVTLTRSIPELVYALILVAAVGIGNLPGIIAIMIHTVGLASKFFSEAIENVDRKPVEAVSSTGSLFIHVIRHSILPQLTTLFSGYTLFILDHNIRVTVAVGIVGAGGIGLELFRRMRQFQYDQVAAMIIIIFLVVLVIDRISAYVRQETIKGTFLSRQNRRWDWPILGGLFVLLGVSLPNVFGQLGGLLRGLPVIAEIILNMIPPDFSETPKYLGLMVETLGMAIAGTVLAVLASIVIGILAARNIMRFRLVTWAMSGVTTFLRAMPDILFALFFVVAVGLGPFAGVVALMLSSIGFLGKFYAEAIENIDPRVVEAIDATGAHPLQRIGHAVVPQVLPLFNNYNLYVLDRNVRASTVLGIVGAGGIGFELTISMRMYNWPQAIAIILLIFAVILAVDYLSTYLRKKIV